MKVCVIHGSSRKNGNTECTIGLVKKTLSRLGEVTFEDVLLPQDLPHFCLGCFACMHTGEYAGQNCPHKQYTHPILQKMLDSDGIVIASPSYSLAESGQVKAFLDHFACEWVVHRPNPNMFHKQALIITTACGAGMSKTVKDIKDSLDYWCVGRVYTYKKGIFQGHWDEINPEVQESMKKKVLKIADKIKKREGNVTPRLKVKALFYIFRSMHGKKQYNPVDVGYWKEKGWLGKVRPW